MAVTRRRRPTVATDFSRTQCGVRLERRLLKVLKGLAEYLDLSLAELIELMAVQAFDGQPGFSEGTRKRIVQLKKIYGMDYTAEDLRARLYTDHR